jgi:hypothetical protein
MDISEVIKTALMHVRWVSYAGMCDIERNKISDLLEKVKIIQETEKIKAKIEENESVIQMLLIHGTEASVFRVNMRIESLKEELKKIENE